MYEKQCYLRAVDKTRALTVSNNNDDHNDHNPDHDSSQTAQEEDKDQTDQHGDHQATEKDRTEMWSMQV